MIEIEKFDSFGDCACPGDKERDGRGRDMETGL